MLIYEDLGLKASKDDPVSQAALDDLKLNFYIVCIVFAGALLVLIGCVIGLFAWVQKLALTQKKAPPPFSTRSLGRALKPNEELAKRYTISAHDNEPFDLAKNPLSRQPSLKRAEPDVLSGAKYNHNQIKTGPSKQSKKRSQHESIPIDGMHFVEDRLKDDLYY